MRTHGFLQRPFGVLTGLVWLLLLVGCHQQVQPKPIVKRDNRMKWMALAPFIKNHFDTDMTVREITEYLTAEEAYREYLMNKE